MKKQTLIDMLKSLPERMGGPIPSGLAAEIKRRIPAKLMVHRMDTISIIVDLRISRLVAAGIILALLLLGGLIGSRGNAKQMLHESAELVKFKLAGEDAYKDDVLSGLAAMRDNLAAQNRVAVYYGDRVDPKDKWAILMYWKISDTDYGVVLGDLSPRVVKAPTLIWLQSRMIEEGLK